jgi:WD40 repeat protein
LNLRAIAARSTAWKAVKNGTVQTEFTDEELGSLLLQPSSTTFTFKVVSFEVVADNVHTNFVDCIACHPIDKAICATGSRDTSIFVWKVDFQNSSSTCLFRYLGHRHWILSLDWMHEGYTILSSSMSSAIHIWRVPYEQHCEKSYRNSTLFPATTVIPDETGRDDSIRVDTASNCHAVSPTRPLLQMRSFNLTHDSDDFSEFDFVRMFIEREEREITLGSFIVSSSALESGFASKSTPSVKGDLISYTSCHAPLVTLDLTDASFPWQTKDKNKQVASSVRFLGTESMWLLSIENESLTYNVKDHILTSLFRGHNDKINSIAFNPLLDVFFTASSDKYIKAWDISRAPEFKLLEHGSLSRITTFVIGHQSIDSYKDVMECTFFFGCSDGSLGANKCYKPTFSDSMTSVDYSLSNASSKHSHGITSLSYFHKYKASFPEILASGDENGNIMLWNASERKLLRTLMTTRANPIVGSQFFLPEVASGEDVFLNLFTMTGDAFCVVWNAESGIALRFVQLSIPSVSHVHMCTNSALSVLSHPSSSAFTLFDYVTLGSLGLVKPQFLVSESQTLKSLTLSIDGERCAMGSSTGDICLLESHSRQIIALGKHHQQEVHVLLWTRFMNRLVSASGDMTLAFWDGAMVPYGGELEASLDLFSVMTPIHFTKLDATLTVMQECANIPCKAS